MPSSRPTRPDARKASKPPQPTPAVADCIAPLALQQGVLDAFAAAFPSLLNPNTSSETLNPLLQELKHCLYHRDFAGAFSRQDLLEAYAVRWSAGRSLAYLEILGGIWHHLPAEQSVDPSVKVVCLGGGAGAELAGLYGLNALRCSARTPEASEANQRALDLALVDFADWSAVIANLHSGLSSLQDPYDAHNVHVNPLQLDLLDTTKSSHNSFDFALQSAQLVTLFFTLNELYTTSLPQTQTMLLELTEAMKPGSVLLVVDSPGSYSTVKLGSNKAQGASESPAKETPPAREYPMAWLLDHHLSNIAAKAFRRPEGQGPWERMDSCKARWFRMPDGLRYPIKLENMRYQMHLYRRT